MDNYPNTVEKRKEGMAMLRARMLAAHQRQIASGTLKDGDLSAQKRMVDVIKSAQTKRGE